MRVDVAREHIGFAPIALDGRRLAGVVDRIQEVEHLDGLVAGSDLGQGEERPHGGVRVLTAVLADAGRVTADVARIGLGLVEGRRQQQDDAERAAHEMGADRVEGALGAARRDQAGQDGPRLRQRVDATFGVPRRSEGRAVVEIPAEIPVAVPRQVEHRTEARDLGAVARRALVVAAAFAPRGERAQHRTEEESEPDAFAPAFDADAAHAVVPVAAAHERQAVRTHGDRVIDGADAVIEQRRSLRRW